MIEAWLIPKGHKPMDVSTPSAVQLQCIEGVRVLTLEDCTVSVISVFPDNTAYVITRKTFPKAVIDAGRRKWKIENHARHYGMSGSQFYEQQQAAQGNYNTWGGPSAQQASVDDFDRYVHEVMDSLWKKGK